MKKIILAICLAGLPVAAKAQYGSINAVLDRLEENRNAGRNLEKEDINNRKFVFQKDFDDHTERDFIVLKDGKATYVEIFDDKKSGQSSTNVFTGDYLRTENNVVSLRCDRLEGELVQMPVTKTLMMMKQKKILYLVDINTKDRWIDEDAIVKNTRK